MSMIIALVSGSKYVAVMRRDSQMHLLVKSRQWFVKALFTMEPVGHLKSFALK